MVQLLHLPFELLEDILGQAALSAEGICHRSARTLAIRLVHSTFKAALDPVVFRSFTVTFGTPVPSFDEPTSRHLQLLALTHVRQHVRDLRVWSTWNVIEYSAGRRPETLDNLLQLGFPRLEFLALHRSAYCYAGPLQLPTGSSAPFPALRSLNISDPSGILYLSRIANRAPRLAQVTIGGSSLWSYAEVLSALKEHALLARPKTNAAVILVEPDSPWQQACAAYLRADGLAHTQEDTRAGDSCTPRPLNGLRAVC